VETGCVLDGKVVLITGGGRGIGRECALLAARTGAKVIVNDFGGSERGGDQGSESPAREVAAEICAAGGTAVSNSDSVTSMTGVTAMVEQALDVYGDLHAVMNPAGILRDKMLCNMSSEDWKAVLAVHLDGAFNVARASITHFRKAGSGVYVFFTSTSGLIGSIGQANYAAAKMGVTGLSRIVALEGRSHNIRANVIAPFAWTRLAATIPLRDAESARRLEIFRRTMRADQVAQLAVALCADGARHISGEIFCVRGNEIVLFSQPRPVRRVVREGGWTPESILAEAFVAIAPEFTGLHSTWDVLESDSLP
jgi:NAD(P)-dependent dehydrogenase (short-subunit alcohol dehydrogenase family)